MSKSLLRSPSLDFHLSTFSELMIVAYLHNFSIQPRRTLLYQGQTSITRSHTSMIRLAVQQGIKHQGTSGTVPTQMANDVHTECHLFRGAVSLWQSGGMSRSFTRTADSYLHSRMEMAPNKLPIGSRASIVLCFVCSTTYCFSL